MPMFRIPKNIQYQHNFEKWNNLSMDIGRVHEDLAKLKKFKHL